LQMRSQANEDPTVTRQAIAAIWFRPLPDARVRLELQVRLLEGSFPTAAIGPLPGRRPVPMKKATVALARWTLLEDRELDPSKIREQEAMRTSQSSGQGSSSWAGCGRPGPIKEPQAERRR